MAISLRLTEQLMRRLTATAKAKGISNSELIRNCLSDYLAAEDGRPSAWDLGQHLFGCYDSRRGDLSARAGEIARERIHARRAAKNRR